MHVMKLNRLTAHLILPSMISGKHQEFLISKSYSLRLLFAICMILYSIGWNQSPRKQSSPPLPNMTVATPVKKQIVEWDAYTGRLETIEFVEIRSHVGGSLESIPFDEGQVVDKYTSDGPHACFCVIRKHSTNSSDLRQ
ncbi:MAG TPA: hypothetical protein DIW81_22265 [Planctomycetaceae bacterium]|nr:hypothetical protein [Planctomycetaceae bacterium]